MSFNVEDTMFQRGPYTVLEEERALHYIGRRRREAPALYWKKRGPYTVLEEDIPTGECTLDTSCTPETDNALCNPKFKLMTSLPGSSGPSLPDVPARLLGSTTCLLDGTTSSSSAILFAILFEVPPSKYLQQFVVLCCLP